MTGNAANGGGIIGAFASHRIAANLLMFMMICSGFFVANRLETRFFPEFNTKTVIVSAVWRGASAEDVADSLLTPMENELRNVPDLKRMTSTAQEGVGIIYLEFYDRAEQEKAADDTRRYLDIAAASLPADAETPETRTGEFPDEILRLSLSGNELAELRGLARRLEAELLKLGVVRVAVSGLPKDAIEIEFDRRRLAQLGLTPAAVGRQIAAQNVDVSAGDVEAAGGGSRLLRSLSQRQSVEQLANMAILDGNGNFVRLADIATLSRGPLDDETLIYFNNRPAVEFDITRAAGGDAIADAGRVLEWAEQRRQTLPQGVELVAHKQEWKVIESRLNLLINNGMQGLALVLLLLFLMLNWRLAVWVAAGIPAVFMVSLCALYFVGGTLDMLTMFAFIMTTGIVVDDSIVVSENALHHRQSGKPPLAAAVEGSREMFPAILSSTFTTIASFMPLMIIGGPIGSILFVIPLVVVCVLFAALFECFTVLPGHLKGVFARIQPKTEEQKPSFFDSRFDNFQQNIFRPLAALALKYRWVTITAAFVALALSVSLLVGGAVKYRFFPGSELNRVFAQAIFVSGTSRETVQNYMKQMDEALRQTEAEFEEADPGLLRFVSLYMGQGLALDGVSSPANGDEIASMVVELKDGEIRKTRAKDFIRAWRAKLPPVAGLDNLSILEESAGPPGEDLNVRLTGSNLSALKAAAEDLRAALAGVPGVENPKDDMPYGKSQIVFSLTSLGRSLNLSANDIAAQLRDSFNGYKAQTLYEGVDEVEVRTALAGGNAVEDFAGFRVRLPNGDFAALADVVDLKTRRGFDFIQRIDTVPAAHVIGEINFAATDVGTVLRQVENDLLPQIVEKHGVSYSLAGSRADEVQTANDMKTGLQIAFFAIFIILAAAFASWTLPFIIILTAPLGVIGGILGHWIMGYEMSILSMFGLFALTGIVINDSIILVRDYQARAGAGAPDIDDKLIVEAVCRRLRAILLTSLTTIGGLTPLMFETSTQAQFLIPMAISICFGLAFATLLILFVMPAYLSVHNSIGRIKDRLFAPAQQGA